jgi:hypothetical protein
LSFGRLGPLKGRSDPAVQMTTSLDFDSWCKSEALSSEEQRLAALDVGFPVKGGSGKPTSKAAGLPAITGQIN